MILECVPCAARRYQLLAAEAFPVALPGNTIGTVRGRSLRPGGGSAGTQEKGVSGWDLL